MIVKRDSYDLDKDGKVSGDELYSSVSILDLDIKEQKAGVQKFISLIALVMMIIMTIFLFSPAISDSRVEALDNLMGMAYISFASIIGFYFGAAAYMSKQ